MNKAVRNERRKLTATFVNGLAVAVFAIGGLTQVASMVQTGSVSQGATLFVPICVIAAVALHLVARASLGGMEE